MSRHLPALLVLAACACTLTAIPSPQAPNATPSPVALETEVVATPDGVLTAESVEVAPTAIPQPLPASDLPDPEGFVWVPVAEGFTRPLAVEHAGDSRLFVVEQRGVIWIVQDGQVLPEPFLDIRDRVDDSATEQGLLGLAFHPDFERNGYFYLNYTDAAGDTHIARFQVSPDRNRADPESQQDVLSFDQPFANHNGGGLAFGPDGYLYIAAGDGGSAGDPHGNGQRLDTLLGKILRVDVDSDTPYAIPPDNPFASGGGRPEIWAYGLRNPWRFAFDPLTDDLYIGDVGQNTWEEIDFLPAGAPGGANFGWNLREGAHPFQGTGGEGLIDPVAEYDHSHGCSVTGGLVVRDPSLPAWTGVYLYADYCSGLVWGLLRGPDGSWRNELLFQTGFDVSSFGVGPAGEVFLVHHGGSVFRLTPVP